MQMLKLYAAYGRHYNLQEARADFIAGKDFSTTRTGGQYTSIRDFVGEHALPDTAQYDAVILLVPDRLVTTNMKRCVLTVDEMREITENRP